MHIFYEDKNTGIFVSFGGDNYVVPHDDDDGTCRILHTNWIDPGDVMINLETHVKYMGGKYVLHRDDGPAAIWSNNRVSYFQNGKPLTIEDLDINGMDKVMLILKYVLEDYTLATFGYYRYMSGRGMNT